MASAGRRRGTTVARVRRWLLIAFVVVAVGLAGLIGYTRYRAQKFLTALPKRLGVDIKSETNGFTYSQSVKGRTLFTIHAAKAIQRENGRTTLHDVQITLFGPEGSHRTDSIRGAEFDYDQKNGVARAMGEVHLDLEAPSDSAVSDASKRVAVLTSDLVFLQKLGVAATDAPIHFMYGGVQGEARGAEYDSDTGVLRLRSAVHAAGEDRGKPMTIDAAAAEVDRVTRIATLHAARVDAGGGRASGDVVRLVLGAGGGVRELTATGNAAVQNAEGVKATGQQMVVELSAAGKMQSAVLRGGVRMVSGGGDATSDEATSDEATVSFDVAGRATGARLLRGVQMHQRGATGEDTRLTAAAVDAVFALDGRRSVLRDATAMGDVELRSFDAKGSSTTVHAQRLHAVMAASGGRRYLASLHGDGGTRLEQSDAKSGTRDSAGDVLDVKLMSPGGARAGGLGGGIASAVQTGHVTITQTTKAVGAGVKESAKAATESGKTATESRAVAGRAEFVGATGVLVLTETPSVRSGDFELAATRVQLNQGSGEMVADGAVRATVSAEAGGAHMVAEHAVVKDGGDAVEFSGGTQPARMWSSTGQMEAKTILFDRATGVLRARGELAPVVLTLSGVAGGAGVAAKSSGSPVRISGRTLLYTPPSGGKAGRAEFGGGVSLTTAGSTVLSSGAVAEVRDRAVKAAVGALSGSVERVTATGGVHLQGPGRSGEGESLVYTAASGAYELRGSAATPARVTDSARGTVTGDTLLLHADDKSVEVLGEGGRRVKTETFAGRGASIR